MRISWDPKCEELARYFLTSETNEPGQDQVARLAGQIQQTIEDFLAWELETL